jgi:phosphoglucosamine mutase
MSNMGLERALAGEGLALHRTKVGDRHVLEAMRTGGFNVGGEQSGHIILTDHATTGDGLVAALQVLAELVETGLPAHQLLHRFDPLPQLLKNVRFAGGQPLEDAKVKAVIAAADTRLGETGRLVIRASGTEPLIRVMAEGEDAVLVEALVDEICEAMRKAA